MDTIANGIMICEHKLHRPSSEPLASVDESIEDSLRIEAEAQKLLNELFGEELGGLDEFAGPAMTAENNAAAERESNDKRQGEESTEDAKNKRPKR